MSFFGIAHPHGAIFEMQTKTEFMLLIFFVTVKNKFKYFFLFLFLSIFTCAVHIHYTYLCRLCLLYCKEFDHVIWLIFRNMYRIDVIYKLHSHVLFFFSLWHKYLILQILRLLRWQCIIFWAFIKYKICKWIMAVGLITYRLYKCVIRLCF